MAEKRARLLIDMIPSTTYGKNVRTLLPKADWDFLRSWTYQRAGYVCEICGGRGLSHPVEAHEIWSFSTKKKRQTLIGIMALCPLCHMCKHWGRSRSQGNEDMCIEHIMQVNGWTLKRLYRHIQARMEQHQRRSLVQWTVDISMAQALLTSIRQEDSIADMMIASMFNK